VIFESSPKSCATVLEQECRILGDAKCCEKICRLPEDRLTARNVFSRPMASKKQNISYMYNVLLQQQTRGTIYKNRSCEVLKDIKYCESRSETGFLNGDCGRKPQVNLRSIELPRCSNSIGRGVQPDQWRALDLSLT